MNDEPLTLFGEGENDERVETRWRRGGGKLGEFWRKIGSKNEEK